MENLNSRDDVKFVADGLRLMIDDLPMSPSSPPRRQPDRVHAESYKQTLGELRTSLTNAQRRRAHELE